MWFLQAPKKLVRYHGNQVVTTKGERYQLVKKDETEEMKKTYVNLKPSRKYRFHWRPRRYCESSYDIIVYIVWFYLYLLYFLISLVCKSLIWSSYHRLPLFKHPAESFLGAVASSVSSLMIHFYTLIISAGLMLHWRLHLYIILISFIPLCLIFLVCILWNGGSFDVPKYLVLVNSCLVTRGAFRFQPKAILDSYP